MKICIKYEVSRAWDRKKTVEKNRNNFKDMREDELTIYLFFTVAFFNFLVGKRATFASMEEKVRPDGGEKGKENCRSEQKIFSFWNLWRFRLLRPTSA